MRHEHFVLAIGFIGIRRLIIYGLSLSPLDAELSTYLKTEFDSNQNLLKDIYVVNPDFEQVIQRVRMLLGANNSICITGVHPEDLHKEVHYSI